MRGARGEGRASRRGREGERGRQERAKEEERLRGVMAGNARVVWE